MENLPKTIEELMEAAQRLESRKIESVPAARPQAQQNEVPRKQWSAR